MLRRDMVLIFLLFLFFPLQQYVFKLISNSQVISLLPMLSRNAPVLQICYSEITYPSLLLKALKDPATLRSHPHCS